MIVGLNNKDEKKESDDVEVCFFLKEDNVFEKSKITMSIFGSCVSRDVLDFHNFLSRSYLILTDSGGIQEEAPSLGKPVLVMRDTTERPEGIKAGTLKLVGTNEETIYNEFKLLLTDKAEYERMSQASNPYGDGLASKRIADILEMF